MNVSKKVAVIFGVVGLAAGTAGTMALQIHAATTTSTTEQTNQDQHMRGIMPAAAGSVTAVSGNTLTVSDKRTGTSYLVDASAATIEKITPPTTPPVAGTKHERPTPTTITVSQIVVGDNVIIEGTISGNNIAATKIIDGMMMKGFGGMRHGPRGAEGTVSSINGTTITLTGKDGKTYTVNAGTASVTKVTTSSLADIKVGDSLMVSGATLGTTVTANKIVDGVIDFK